MDREDTQSINIPCWPQVPIVESSPVALGPRKIVTFMIHNLSQSDQVKVRIQLSYDKRSGLLFFLILEAGIGLNRKVTQGKP